jgi:DNA-binding NtrC family response regulator/tetratricopeptide (TPR) repeat protein
MEFLSEVVGESPGIVAVREQLRRLLGRETGGRRLPPLLIRGETGTGKGLLAQAIHRASARADAAFVALNCAAIPEPLLEAELFGYERGAFTDARQAKPGLFQAAHGGTLFLDEAGHLPEPLQAKLLTAIEDRTVRRLGSTRSEPAEVWIIAATSVDLEAAIRAQRFLEALYHRLSVLTVTLPPLRERGGDVVLLAESFLARACAHYALPPKTLSRDARAALSANPWPGNVRELSNLIERTALLAEERVVTGATLGLVVPSGADVSEPGPELGEAVDPFRASLGRFERVRLLEALARTGWNVSQAAALLGIPRNTLRYRIAKHGLRPATAQEVESSERTPGMDGEAEPEGAAAEKPGLVEGETRAVTLLCVTIATPEALEPSWQVGGVLERLAEKVEGFGGQVLSLGPAGLLAAFGLEALEEAPARAAHAALAISKASEAGADAGVPSVVVAIALHGGGFPTRRTGRGVPEVAGDARIGAETLLAALAAQTPAGAILVTREAAILLERRFELEAWKALEGVPGPIYRLLGRERTGYGLGGRPLSRFVGRERELELMADLLARARAGRGQLLGIVGEPGVGKSRLIYEFTRPHRVPGCLVLQGAAVPHGTAIAYLPVVELLRRYFRIEERDPAPGIRDKVSAALSSLDERLGDAAAPLQSLMGALPPEDPFRSFDRRRRQRRALDALKRLVVRESQHQPVLLVLEDVQWIDPESQAVLNLLAESLPTAAVLLLMSYRPEYQHALAGRSYYTQLRVDPLGAESAHDLLEALLGTDASLAPLGRRLIERTGGNPFFLEESVRSVIDAAIVVGSPGAYRAVEGAERIEVPASVRVLLAARIDRLDPEAKRLLQSAAVIGTTVARTLLQAIEEAPAEVLHDGLARLRAAEFLYERAVLPGGEEYTFAHELTHEVAYESLLPHRRRDLHARIVSALDCLDPGRTMFAVERLAHHAWKGEVWDRAVSCLRETGIQALARSCYDEARTSFERALVALAHFPDSPAARAQEIDIRLDLGEALTALGQHGPALDCLRRATAVAEASNDGPRLGRVLASVCQGLRMTHANEDALGAGRRALAVAAVVGDPTLQAEAACHLGQVCLVVGDFREAVRHLGRCAAGADQAAFVDGSRHTHDRATVRAWLALALAHLGRFDEGIAEGETAVRLAESEDRPHGLIAAHAALGAVCLERGDCFRAIILLERALALSRTWGLFEWASGSAASLGYAYVLAGRAGEAGPLWVDDAASEAPIGALGGEARRLAYRGAGRLATGNRHEAASDARRSLEVAMTRQERGNEAWALQLLGDLAGGEEVPEAETADQRYREARALADERGMRPLVARCHLGLGALYRRAVAPTRAREHLTTAVAMFRDMDMRLWLERADAERQALG